MTRADVIRGEHVSWSKDELTIYCEFDSIVSTKKLSISTSTKFGKRFFLVQFKKKKLLINISEKD